MENNIIENRKKTIRIIFNGLIIFFVVLGVVIDVIKLDTATALSAFTIQSNLLCLIAAAVTLALEIKKKDAKGKAYIFFKGMTLTSIFLTFIVYNFILKPLMGETDNTQSFMLADALLHTVVPLMMLGDFIFFEKKGCFKIWYPFGWTAFPLYYVGYTAIYKAFGGIYKYHFNDTVSNFPYFFLDYESYGLRTVGIWFLFIVIGFIGFSYLLLGLDKLFCKIKMHG